MPTLEWLTVPNGYAVELKLGSSHARQGYEQVAVWLDPGWWGTATMGIRNATRYTPLPIGDGGCSWPRSSSTSSTSPRSVPGGARERQIERPKAA